MKKSRNKIEKIVIALFIITIIAISTYFSNEEEIQTQNTMNNNKSTYEISNIPEYSGEIYVEINNNIPKFTDEDMNIEEDYYSSLENKKVRNGYDKNKLEKSK